MVEETPPVTVPRVKQALYTREQALAFLDQVSPIRYESVEAVTAIQLRVHYAWTSPSGSPLTAGPGDWLVSDTSGHRWTVAAAVFTHTYRELSPGVYVKTSQVRMVQMTVPFCVQTLEGWSAGEPGDWLAAGSYGDVWPIPRHVAERHYQRAVGNSPVVASGPSAESEPG